MIETLSEIYLANPVGQTLGIIAFITGVIRYLHKEDTKMYYLVILANIFWVTHYSILGLYTGAIIDFIAIIRIIAAIKFKKNKKIIGFFIVIYIIIGMFLFKEAKDILPIIAGILGLLAFMYFSGIKARLILLICSSLWLTYNFLGDSIAGVTAELFMITAGLITITRLHRDNKIKNTSLN